MKTLRKIIILSSLLLIGLFGTNLVTAGFITDPIVPCGGETQSDCTLCHLWELASNIINFISFNLAVPMAVLLFIAAGIMFLISGGNQEKVALARSIFTNTIIGLVIIFASWLLIDTLLKTIATGAFSGAWNVFPTCP
ncbi:MAG: hypothetical protein ISS88_03210 [Candidatus Portnoybacteria bacterium]|nr:hypothetical protein [Candidatus Portnoybacteria bacterium]